MFRYPDVGKSEQKKKGTVACLQLTHTTGQKHWKDSHCFEVTEKRYRYNSRNPSHVPSKILNFISTAITGASDVKYVSETQVAANTKHEVAFKAIQHILFVSTRSFADYCVLDYAGKDEVVGD